MRGLRDDFDFAVYAANGIDPGDVGQSMKRELAEMQIPIYLGTNVPIKFGGMFFAGLWCSARSKNSSPISSTCTPKFPNPHTPRW